jgi:hypothetical protein
MAGPDGIVLGRDRDLDGRRGEVWARRAVLAVIVFGLPVVALANGFGQHPQTTRGAGTAATLEVYAPERVRSGLIFQARYTVDARRTLTRAALRFDPGWFEGLSVNSIEPQPQRETSDDGRTLLTLGRISAGKRFTLYTYYQVNPTNVGRRSQDVELLDGRTPIARVERTLTIFP